MRHTPKILVAASCLAVFNTPFAQRAEDKPLPPPEPVLVEHRFDFRPGPPAEGFTSVAADAVYSIEKGYGLDFGTQ
ncbi:MAG TPA: hypothetical protein VJB15_11695, partial [Rhodothermia bacterium]|nr:hypothetical protein [Rhodothermia bacterium]